MRKLLILVPIMALAALATPAGAGEPAIVHHEVAADWRFAAAAPGEPYAELSFTALGRAWRAELAANAVLLGQLEAAGFHAAGRDTMLYRGRLEGVPGSWLRLAHTATGWQGLIWDGSELLAVDAAEALDGLTETPVGATGRIPVVFRAADVRLPPDAVSCAAAPTGDPPPVAGKAALETVVRELKAAADQAVDVAMIGDADFASRHAIDPESALAVRLNNIDGIFSEQVGVTLNVTEFRVFDPASDPLTASTDARNLLDDLGRYKLADSGLRPLALVHLYTGRDLDGTTAGIAYTGGLCRSQFGAGLSEGRRTVITDTLIGAHEIGHNFGAPHDGEAGSPCESTPETFLMAPRINNSSTFSTCSLEQIAAELAGTTCLRAVSAADMSLTVDGPSSVVAQGSRFPIDITATNAGTELATGVSVSIELPASLALDDGGVSCVAAAGGAECDIGNVAPGAASAFTLNLEALSPGDSTVRATVSADEDSDAGNDTDSVTIRIVPAVDLSLSLDAPAALTEDTTTDIVVRVDNLSSRTASNLVLELTVPANLAVENIGDGAFSCNTGGAAVSCSAGSLGAGASAVLTLTVRGVVTGTGQLRAEVSADEPDPVSANNAVVATLEVRPASATTTPSSASAAGGGGGGHGLGLVLLATLALARRRRR